MPPTLDPRVDAYLKTVPEFALPMFTVGMVLGAASRVHEWIAPPGALAFAWAGYGSAAGMLLAGTALRGTRFLPATLLLLCVVVLSAGSLLQALGIDDLEGRWLEPEPRRDRRPESPAEPRPESSSEPRPQPPADPPPNPPRESEEA